MPSPSSRGAVDRRKRRQYDAAEDGNDDDQNKNNKKDRQETHRNDSIDEASSTGATIPHRHNHRDRYMIGTGNVSIPESNPSHALSASAGQTTDEDDDDDDEETDDDRDNDSSTRQTISSDDEDDDDEDLDDYDGSSYMTDDYSDMMTLEGDFDMEMMSTALQAANPAASGWVDSACSWLDRPMCALGMGSGGSLLHRSKGRSRSTINQMYLDDALSQSGFSTALSVMERRNLRLHRKNITMSSAATSSMAGDVSTLDGTDGGSVVAMTEDHIQLNAKKNDKDVTTELSPPHRLDIVVENDGDEEEMESTLVNAENKPNDEEESHDMPAVMHPPSSRDVPDDESSENELDEKVELPQKPSGEGGDDYSNDNSFENDARRLTETPSPLSVAAETTEHSSAAALAAVSLDLPESESIRSGTGDSTEPLVTDSPRVTSLKPRSKSPHPSMKNASARSTRSDMKSDDKSSSRRSASSPLRRGKIESEITDLTNVADNSLEQMRGLPAAPSGENFGNGNGRKFLPNGVEIIDVQSLEDRQSWSMPTNRDPIPSNHARKALRSDLPDDRVERDPSPSFAARRTHANQGRDPSPSRRGRTTLTEKSAADLFQEEEAKLSNKSSRRSRSAKIGAVAGLTSPETAEDLWTEEEKKLHIIPPTSNIFDDPEVREAFLGHRRGQLQDSKIGETHRLPSPSRSQSRRRMAETIRAHEALDRERAANAMAQSRSKSTEKIRPNLMQSRSASRERRHEVRDSRPPVKSRDAALHQSSINQTPTRRRHINDLASIRKIEDDNHHVVHSTVHKSSDELHHESRDPMDVQERVENESSGIRSRHKRQDEYARRRSKSRDADRAQMLMSKSGRDDLESRQSLRSRRGSLTQGKEWPDYETVISATKELKKLEKKIEKQLRTVRRETRGNQERDNDSRVSSKEIRKLEKHLAQKLKRDNEKRGAKLKRIKRRTSKRSTPPAATSTMVDQYDQEPPSLQQRLSSQPSLRTSAKTTGVDSKGTTSAFSNKKNSPQTKTMTVSSPTAATTTKDIAATTAGKKSFSQKVDDFRERSKFDQLRVLRSSRYLRPTSRGRRSMVGGEEGEI